MFLAENGGTLQVRPIKSVSLLRQHLKSDPTEPPETPREDPEGGGDEEAGGEAEAEAEGEGQKLQRPTSASSSRLKPKLPPLEKPADD